MRRKWVWDPKAGELVEVPNDFRQIAQSAGIVMPDIEPFVSPVDGSVVTGRRALREHNKRNNVTNTSDFTKQWEKQAEDRARLFTGGSGYDRQRRIGHLKQNYDKLSRGRK